MISVDMEFIIPALNWLRDNPITVGLFFFILGAFAKATPWVADDKILTFLKGLIMLITPGSGVTANNIKEKYALPTDEECADKKKAA